MKKIIFYYKYMYNYFMNFYCIHVHVVVEIMLKHPVELVVNKD